MDPFQAWLATRPECVQKLAAEFPLGTVVQHDGKALHLLGYNEDDMLILSEIDPHKDYDGANENKVYICAAQMPGAAAEDQGEKK